jgi:hypothetical protein
MSIEEEKKYYLNEDMTMPANLLEEHPRANRCGFCSYCRKIVFVDSPGGPFIPLGDSCSTEEDSLTCEDKK